MHFGGAMFFTDYSMSAMELARALEGARFRIGLGAHFPSDDKSWLVVGWDVFP